MKSTTSAKTINSGITPILRSGRGVGNRGGVDSEGGEHNRVGDFTHTEFTETVNDDEDYDQDDMDNLHGHGGNDTQSEDSSLDYDTTYNNITHHHINLGEHYSGTSLWTTTNTNTNQSQQQQFQQLWGHYVLFLDPESFIYYRKDLKRDDYIVMEPLMDEQLKEKFQQANKIHLYKIRKLLVLEGFSWNFKGEADMYRRRPFPR